VLGRFLEHSRIFSFQCGEESRTWIGSADLLPRNLDRRIEVLAPLEDARTRAEVNGILNALLMDTKFSWTLDSQGVWHRNRPSPSGAAVSAQELLLARTAKSARKSQPSDDAVATGSSEIAETSHSEQIQRTVWRPRSAT
jgi:polyphosphate kinase